MSRATATALTVIRVPRGADKPSEAEFQAALELDRSTLQLAHQPVLRDFAVAGPYRIDGPDGELDEYVVWER